MIVADAYEFTAELFRWEGNAAWHFLGLPEDGITVVIGAENADEAMSDCSVIVSRYGTRQGLAGAVAIVGPTRMQYSRAVPAVRFMASVMSDLLTAYYGPPDQADS